MEEGLWYVRREGRVTGPITGLDVRAGIAARRLQPDVELSKDKVTWVAATEVPGLVGAPTPGAPAPAPGVAAAGLLVPPAPALPRASAAAPSPSRFGPPPEKARSRTRYRPAAGEPMTGLPEPDAWSARWGITLAVVSLVAWVLPISTGLLGEPDVGRGSRWLFPWSPEVTREQPFLLQLVQPGAAVAAILIVRMLRGAARGIALLAVTLGSVLASVLFQAGRGGLDMFTGPAAGNARAGGLIVLAFLAGGLGVAVGNHLRKRSPERGPGRALCAAGGALLVLVLVVPIEGTPIFKIFFEFRLWGIGWPLLLLLVSTLTYGVLGLRHLSSDPAYEGRCILTSTMGRVLLAAPPVAFTVFLLLLTGKTNPGSSLSFFGILLLMGKGWGAFVGLFALIGVGLAAWFEDGLYRAQPRAVDPRAAAEVFR